MSCTVVPRTEGGPWVARLPASSPRGRKQGYRLAIAVFGALAASACGSGTATTGATGSPPPFPTEFASELLGPMSALPDCDVEPVPDGVGAIPGLWLPDDATIVERRSDGGVTQAFGWVELTPIQLLDRYVRRDDLDLEQAEHEEFESELLYEVGAGDGRARVYIKAQVACATGSNLVVFVGPATRPGDVPTPAGRG